LPPGKSASVPGGGDCVRARFTGRCTVRARQSTNVAVLPHGGRAQVLRAVALPVHIPISVKIGIVSDIHSNVDALVAVRRALDAENVEQVICLGDVVGYNAFPRETIALQREMGISSVVGNHDLMVLGQLPASDCGPRGRRAVAWTAKEISPEDRGYLAGLPAGIRCGNHLLFVHSSPG